MWGLNEQELGFLIFALTLLAGGAGFLLKRWIGNSATHERVSLLNGLADLRSKLGEDENALKEVEALEAAIKGTGPVSVTTAQAIGVLPGDEKMPGSYWTWPAVSARTHARYEVVNAQVAEALIELRSVIDDNEWEYLDKSFEAWEAYRQAEMSFAGSQFEGGSLSPVTGTLRGIELSEEKLADLKAATKARIEQEL